MTFRLDMSAKYEGRGVMYLKLYRKIPPIEAFLVFMSLSEMYWVL